MRGCEIKQLKWRDVDLMERTLTIRKSKTEAGERVIPLNADACNAVLPLYRRAQALGEVLPCIMYSPRAKPLISTLRGLWQAGELHGATFGTQPGFQTFASMMMHHAITELAESQASDSTVMAIAGHVSPKMLQHYSHVRLQASGLRLMRSLQSGWIQRVSGAKRGVTTQRATQNTGTSNRSTRK